MEPTRPSEPPWGRLWLAVHPEPHAVETATLGEYAALLRAAGPAAAGLAYPAVAAHLATGCPDCAADLDDLFTTLSAPAPERWLDVTPLLAWSYAGADREARATDTPPGEAASNTTSLAIALYAIEEYPELLLEATPAPLGIELRLAVRPELGHLPRQGRGWAVRLQPRSLPAPEVRYTDDQGRAAFEAIAMGALLGAQIAVLPPSAG